MGSDTKTSTTTTTTTYRSSEHSPLLNEGLTEPWDGRDTSRYKGYGGVKEPVVRVIERSAASSDTADSDDDEERQAKPCLHEGLPDAKGRMKYIFPALAIGVFLASADQTLIVSSYGIIGSELKALSSTSWIATAYLLTLTSFQPLYGKLSDIFGRRPALISAYAIFGLGCLFCGLSRSMGQLIAARAFAGIGGGGMTTVVSVLLSDLVPLRDRGAYQGYMNIVYAFGAGLGAPLGGYLADSIGWKWAFLGQAPLTLLAMVTVHHTVPLPQSDKTNWRVKLGRIDFLGAFVLVSSVFTLLLGLHHGSNGAWTSPHATIPLCAAVVLFAAFVLVEAKIAREPLAPARLMSDRSFLACFVCNFFSFGGWMAVLFYLPLYFQAVDGLSATQAGMRLIPGIVAGVAGSLFAGFTMKRTGKYYGLTVAAYVGLMWGFLPIILFSGLVVTSTWGISAGLAISGFGNGVGVTSTLVALVAQSSSSDLAVATACSYLFRSLGSVIGVSLSSTVVQQLLRAGLRAQLRDGAEAELIVQRVRQSLDYIQTMEPHTRALVRRCYAGATRAGFCVDACLVAGAFLGAFWIRERKLTR